jgi:clan AA aspartic protease (TIGR02281 family)
MSISFDPLSPVIVLDVEIEGAAEITTKRLALDTGATYMLIPWAVAELLGYDPLISEERITLITASGVETAPIIELKSVSVLGRKATNVKAVVHDLPQRSYVDGLLGLSVLRNFKVILDFKNGILEIE